MRRFPLASVLTLVLTFCLAAPSWGGGSFQLKPGLRWLTVAETPDQDSAIGIANHYQSEKTRIIRTSTGALAVVLGPFRAQVVSQLRRERPNLPPIPPDARLSRGDDFLEQVWQSDKQLQAAATAPLSRLAQGKKRKFKIDDLAITVEVKRQKRQTSIAIAGLRNTQEEFSFVIPQTSAETPTETEIGLVQLDASTKTRQLVIARYSGGAHCCTETWIVTKPNDSEKWQLVDAGALDGIGYGFEDVDKDGALELINVDNAFLYAFDSYAASYAPVKYAKLIGDKIVDVSQTDAFKADLRRDLAYLEFDAKLNPETWKTNGFLAGWVASKIRLGQGEDAWATLLENYDRNSEFSSAECDLGDPAPCDTAPSKASFPQALAVFLQESGYGPLPQTALSSLR